MILTAEERQIEEDVRLGHTDRRNEPTLNQRIIAACRKSAVAERERLLAMLWKPSDALAEEIAGLVEKARPQSMYGSAWKLDEATAAIFIAVAKKLSGT